MPDKKIAIFGSSGGIGGAILKQLLTDTTIKEFHCFNRSLPDNHDDPRIINHQLDPLDETALGELENVLPDDLHFSLIFIALGILHDEQGLFPEKKLADLNTDNFAKAMQINSLAPALIIKHLQKFIKRDQASVLAALSARVGSISDNHLGGWHSYRAAKAALNMLLKNIAIEFSRTKKQAIVIGLHPGTVATKLSQPFSSNVKADKLFTPEFSAQKLLEVITKVTVQHSGKIFAWDGKIIDY